MSRALLVVAVVSLALGTWLLLRSDDLRTTPAEAPVGAPELAPVEAPRGAIAEAALTTEVVVEAAADASAPVPPGPSVEIAIIVVEVDGTERNDLDGEGEALL